MASQTKPAFKPADDDSRQRIAQDLDKTLFVEAGAGTGKTTSLVGRVVNLIASGAATPDRLAAITFTEAAAAELRDRIRDELQKAAANDDMDPTERRRCEQGVADLDRASIQTLHSFAAMLLRERPLEAGLPPGFDTLDEIQSDLDFQDAWTDWLDRAIDDPALEPALSLAFTLGMRVGDMRGVAERFHANYDLLPNADDAFGCVMTEIPPSDAAAALAAAVPELQRLCRFSEHRGEDPLYAHTQALLESIRRLAAADPATPAAYRQLAGLSVKQTKGRQADWRNDDQNGVNACKRLKETLAELSAVVQEELDARRQEALLTVCGALSRFAREYTAERKQKGRAEFHDLLVWARDMLRDNLAARDHFRARFTHLLIDEAQDTDPIQTEIAMFLAEDAPTAAPASASASAAPARPVDWREITPKRGKLFVVGDAKQSIYRFRRADVSQMNRLQTLLENAGGASLPLTQNFRSQRMVVEWVNALFERWMADGGESQAQHKPIAHRWNAQVSDGGVAPRVWRFGEPMPDERNVASVRRAEARAIAELTHQIRGEKWRVLDSAATQAHPSGAEIYKPAQYSDICILMPRRTGLRMLEQILEEAGVPYRIEGASLFFETQEARDILNCLRAIDDPADEIAIVAALRSPAFACSDAELLRFRKSRPGSKGFNSLNLPDGALDGGPPNSGNPVRNNSASNNHSVASASANNDSANSGAGSNSASANNGNNDSANVIAALRALRSLHEDRLWESTAALMDRFIRDNMLMEAAVHSRSPREQWRRYRFLVERARAFAAAGGNSLRAFNQWLGRQMEENNRVSETPVPESDEDAVRIMTVHGAKGLEFPIVILTAINSQPRNDPGSVIFDRDSGKAEIAVGRKINKTSPFRTSGYEELADREKKLESDEQTRLMYVAATRARDHLILSLRRPENDKKSHAATIAAMMQDDHPDLWDELQLNPQYAYAALSESAAARRFSIDEDAHSPAARDKWRADRAATIAAASRPASVAATRLKSIAEHAAPSAAPDAVGYPSKPAAAAYAAGPPDPDDKREAEADSDAPDAEPTRRGRAGTAIGRAVHAVLQTCDIATGDGIDAAARTQAVAEGVPAMATTIASLARVAVNSPIVKRAAQSGRYWREVPIAAPIPINAAAGGGALEGVIDLIFEEDGELVIVDYKTDNVGADAARYAAQRYGEQAGAYVLAAERAVRKPVRDMAFLFLTPQAEVSMRAESDLPALKANAERLAAQAFGGGAPSDSRAPLAP